MSDPRLLTDQMRNTLSCFPGMSPWEPYMLELSNVRAAIEAGYLWVGPVETHIVGTKVCQAHVVCRTPKAEEALATDREARRPLMKPKPTPWLAKIWNAVTRQRAGAA